MSGNDEHEMGTPDFYGYPFHNGSDEAREQAMQAYSQRDVELTQGLYDMYKPPRKSLLDRFADAFWAMWYSPYFWIVAVALGISLLAAHEAH